MAGQEARESLHVALLPWLAFGHLIPFLQLAIALADADLRVSFLSSPKNIRRLPRLPSHLILNIRFVELPLPSVDGLPEGAEATVDVNADQIQYLKIAYDQLVPRVKRFVAAESVDLLLHDVISHWAPAAARETGVACAMFSVFSAATLTFIGPIEALAEDRQLSCRPSPESLTTVPDWVPFPSTVAFNIQEAKGFHAGFFGPNASGVRDSDRCRLAVGMTEFIAVRSCNEYEGEYLDLLAKLYKKPVIPVGLLPPAIPQEPASKDESGANIFSWLDAQKPSSTLFVSFGSEYKLTRDEVHELAYGLELSNVPFLWVLRRPAWLSNEEGDEEALPSGFKSRIKGRGAENVGWAPQLEILAHPSIGGSLFHSGWGSVIETLRHGHALILMPFIIDQGLNARLLVEKRLALQVDRCADGMFGRAAIARAVRAAMASEEGEALRARAKEVGATFGDQALHGNYVKGFVQYLLRCKAC